MADDEQLHKATHADDERDELEPDPDATAEAREDRSEGDGDSARMNPEHTDEKALFERIWARIQTALGSKGAGVDDDDGTGFKVMGNHWLAVWSNDFKDREGEIFTRKAIDDYVNRVDMGIVPLPELWDSHIPGTKSGRAEWVGRHGHFLLAGGAFDDTPRGRAARDYYSKHAKEQGISHGYRFRTNDFDGTHYRAFNTFEISPLPRGAEANRFTSLEGIKAMTLTEQKKQRLIAVYGKEEAEKILATFDEKGKQLEALQVEYKEFSGSDLHEGVKEDGESALATALKDLVPALMEGQSEAVDAATKALEGVLGMDKRLKRVEAFIAQTPKRASKAAETELDPEDEEDKQVIDQIEVEQTDEKAAKAFPGLFSKKPSVTQMFNDGMIRR